MNEKVFDRIEKKYLITKSQKEALLALIQKNMTEDNYFHSDVMNIYFDNDNYDLIVQCLSKSRPK